MPAPDPLPPPSSVALRRYLVVSQVLAEELSGVPRPDAIGTVVARALVDQAGRPISVKGRTVYRWLAQFELHGIAGLEPAARERTDDASDVIAPDVLAFMAKAKAADAGLSVPELIRQAEEHEQFDIAKDSLCRATVWRALRRVGVNTRRRKQHPDQRRWAYPHRMQMALCDGKHFRAGAGRVKRVALVFLDNATRLGLDVLVGPSESTLLFLTGLYQMISRHGLMDALYLDRGPGFRSDTTASVVGEGLRKVLILGSAGYAEGHGAIERFNRTLKQSVLRHLTGRPDVDPSCEALTLRLRHWLHEIYNHTPHEGLGKETPWERWSRDSRGLSFPESHEELRAKFVVAMRRRVTKDNTVPVDGVAHEIPMGHAGERILLTVHALDGEVRCLHEGRMVRIHPVDLAANARAKRAQDPDPTDPAQQILAASAADMAFEKDFGPIVDDDGGYAPPPPSPQEYPDG